MNHFVFDLDKCITHLSCCEIIFLYIISHCTKYLAPPDTNKASSIVFKTINARSCHLYPTHNQQPVPIIEKNTSYTLGTSCIDLHNTARQMKITPTHFTYQVASCNGVTFLILFCVLLIHPVDHIVSCNETSTLGHIFESSCTNVCTGTSYTT